ncbi:hypothetical protein HanIR_Chr10g0487841 [Helianthus annuus]|nr:hypothetical protein HanIR_Chr10g0487841 [Helianthus annuus]
MDNTEKMQSLTTEVENKVLDDANQILYMGFEIEVCFVSSKTSSGTSNFNFNLKCKKLLPTF